MGPGPGMQKINKKNASGLNGFEVMETGSVVSQLENRQAHVAMHNVADNTEANPAKRHTAHVTVINNITVQ